MTSNSRQKQRTQERTADSQTSSTALLPKDMEKKINEVVQYILIMGQKRIPIKRADINKNVLKDNRVFSGEIIKKAAKKLEQIFGLKLIEIDTKVHVYILVGKLSTGHDMPCSSEDKLGLLLVVLSIIFMKGNVINSSLLWFTLKKFGVDPSFYHPVFGDVKKLITEEFVRQKYLEHTRALHTDVPEYKFSWGSRAFAETSKLRILDFVSKGWMQSLLADFFALRCVKMFGNTPQDWLQYKDAMNHTGSATQTPGRE